MLRFKPSTEKAKDIKPRKKINLVKILAISNIVTIALVVISISGMGVIHQSDTNPNFCRFCHIMEPNVSSYLTSNDMDNVHYQAGVQCKDCHDYPIDAEIKSGINYLVGKYSVDEQGVLLTVTYEDDMCFQCHISYDFIINTTDFLHRNPHNSHWGKLPCSACHISHGQQIDYCSGCHDNGGQRILGETIEVRETIGQ